MSKASQHDYTKVISLRLSSRQYQKILDLIGDERPSDYIRKLIELDIKARGETFPRYEFVDNETRSELKIRGRGKDTP